MRWPIPERRSKGKIAAAVDGLLGTAARFGGRLDRGARPGYMRPLDASMFSGVSFGVDTDASGWAVVRACRRWGRVVTQTIAASARGEEAADCARRLREALSGVPAARCEVAAAAPAAETIVRRVEVPGASPARARAVVGSLLDVQLPFRIEDCAVAVPELRRKDGGTSALAAVIPREALARRCEALVALGVRPTVLDVEGLAVWEAALREAGEPAMGELRVAVHATASRWVCAFGSVKGLEGVVTVREPPGEEGSAGWERVDVMLRSAVANQPREREFWVWCGRPAGTVQRWAQTMAARRRGTAEEYGRVLADPELALARTLALRALEGMSRCANLLGEDELPAEVRRAKNVAALLACGGLAISSVAALGVEAWRLSAISSRERDLATVVARRAREVGGLSRVQPGLEVRMAREAVERRLEALRPLDRLFQPPQTAVLAGLLRVASEAEIHLETVDLSDQTVRVEGTVPDREAARRMADFFRMLGLVPKMEFGPSLSDGRVPFVMEGGRR
ncbi:MAG: hypothetical protein N2652_00310 [Kiritimatiellae bacterium]|nr:hypothetical protein [Kiritimatiellia bacterium]